MVVASRLRLPGRYHIIDWLTSPLSVIKKILSSCSLLAGGLRKPGTVQVRLQQKEGHIENSNDLELGEEISVGLEGLKRLVHNWAVENNLTYDLVDPTMLSYACDLGLKTRVTCMPDSDPVHLTPDGYRDLALIITDSIRHPGRPVM
jgi:hypothetical protein